MRASTGCTPASPIAMNTTSRRSRRPLMLLPALAAVLAGNSANAAFVIAETTGLFTPSFRGEANSTYFGWANGTWDGNADAVAPDPPIPDIINGTPSINPASGGQLTQAVAADIISGSNNVYSSVSQIDSLGLQLTIPTSGVVGSAGYTTIIIQGFGLNGAMFGASALDGFGFGTIDGIMPEYLIAGNAASKGQWWAKWVLPGNAASYTVDLFGAQVGDSPLVVSVTDMTVDTWFSEDSFSPDFAVVPEPSALLLSFAGVGFALRRRRNA
jgi:hypothetical protein